MNDYRLPSLRQAARRSRDADSVERESFYMPEDYRHLGDGKRFFIYTHGCQANERDSEMHFNTASPFF